MRANSIRAQSGLGGIGFMVLKSSAFLVTAYCGPFKYAIYNSDILNKEPNEIKSKEKKESVNF